MKQSTFARKVLEAVEAAGYQLQIVDDFAAQVATVTEVMDFLESVDELEVICARPLFRDSFLSFVWQGPDDKHEDGAEILSDHGVSLSYIIDPLYEGVK